MLLWLMNLDFAAGQALAPPTTEGAEYTLRKNRLHYTLKEGRDHFDSVGDALHYTLDEED
jgi:hypothetical protein